MINKTIHYCWFGKNKLPRLALKCIESWKKYCPEYEIIEWNEENFDINANRYVKEAYQAKKWAFVSDYVRLYALVNYGGVYMDTDVEVLCPLNEFLSESGFSGFEAADRVPTGIMACEKNHPFFTKLLKDYDHRKFILENGEFDTTTNVITITNAFLAEGLILNNEKQTVCGVTLYSSDVFCPKNPATKVLTLTSRSVTIHHFDGSWVSKRNKFKQKVQILLGDNATQAIAKVKSMLRGNRR